MATNTASTYPAPTSPAAQLLALLGPHSRPVAQLIVNGHQHQRCDRGEMGAADRVVITATRSGGERNATRFGGFWAEALASDEADRDKDGTVTAQEAYDYARRKVGDAYKSDAAHAHRTREA